MKLETVLSAIAVIVGICGLVWALYQYMNLPTVYMNYVNDACVRVENVNTNYTCGNMPSKFHHVWVE